MGEKKNDLGNKLYIFRKEESLKEKKRGIFWFFYFFICGLCMIWPMYNLIGNRIYPFIFGFPFSFFLDNICSYHDFLWCVF